MIDFRYHIVSIVAVFLALALGLFLGSTTLQGPVLNNIRHQVSNVRVQDAQKTQQIRVLSRQLATDEKFLHAATPYITNESLIGDTVAVVSAPGVDGSTRAAMVKVLQQADATVTAQVQLEPLLLDPSKQTLLASLASQLKPAGVSVPSDSGSLAAGSVIASVLGTRPGRTPVPQSSVSSVLQAMQSGGVISVNGDVGSVHPAKLVLVLTPAAAAVPGNERTRDDQTVLAVAREFAAATVGTVLAGPAPTAPGDDALKLAVADGSAPPNFATADSIGTAGGQIAAVLALVAVFNGESGNFGLGSPTQLPAAAGTS